MLLYADDIVFFGQTVSELQGLLDTFSTFCKTRRLTVNLAKTQVVVFCGGRVLAQPTVSLVYRGHKLEQVDTYRYLGVTFHWKRGAIHGGELLLKSARAALFALRQRAREQEIRDTRTLCRLFDSLVLPILLYGCEVWDKPSA